MIEERKRILKMVEEGSLTAEEALLLLEKLETQKAGFPSTHVEWEHEYAHKKQSKQASIKNKLFDFVDSAIQKIKEVDLDLNFGPSYEVNHIFHHKDVELEAIDFDIANGDMKLVPWDENDVRMECRAKVYKVQHEEEARKVFLQLVGQSIESKRLRFFVQKKQIKVDVIVYVPREKYDQVKIRMFNGHIQVSEVESVDFVAKTANGKILINKVKSEELELETANGHVQLHQSHAKTLEVETMNGKIEVDGSFGKVDLQSLTGAIHCVLDDNNTEVVFLKTSAGSIQLNLVGGMEVDGELKSNLGEFTCDLENMEIRKEKKEVVQKELLFIANRGAEKKMQLTAETRAGRIQIKNK